MDSYQFCLDQRMPQRTIDCSTYQSALASIAALLDRSSNELLQNIFRIGNGLIEDSSSPFAFEEELAEQVVGRGFFPVNIEKIYWFHFTRTLESSKYQDGLLPFKESGSKVWEHIIEVFKSIDKQIVKNLQYMECNGFNSPEYTWKMNSEFDQGPFGMLVRDSGFFWKEMGNVDYFSGSESVQDICVAYSRKYGDNIFPLYMKNTVPCIVTFKDECDMESLEGVVQSIISYLFFRPENTMRSSWCYNGNDKIISHASILNIEFNPVGSEVPIEYKNTFALNSSPNKK